MSVTVQLFSSFVPYVDCEFVYLAKFIHVKYRDVRLCLVEAADRSRSADPFHSDSIISFGSYSHPGEDCGAQIAGVLAEV